MDSRPEQAVEVSVIIPVYETKYVREAVESVYAQVYSDYEIIVVNDGAPAGSEAERWLQSGLPRLHYLAQPNRGPSAARNSGIQVARGRFVAFLDADDSWGSRYLAEQIAALRADPTLDLIYCDAQLVGESVNAGRRFMELTPSQGEVTCESMLKEECTVVLSGVVASREAVVKAGLFDERFRHAEDFDLWLRMLKRGSRLAFQDRVLFRRRVHAGSLSHDVLQHGRKALAVLAKFQDRPDLTPAETTAVRWRIDSIRAELGLVQGKQSLAAGDFEAALALLTGANEFYRSWKLRLIVWLVRLTPGLVAWAHRLRGS